MAQSLVAKRGPDLTFDSFHGSLSQLTAGLREATIRPVNDAGTAEALRWITSVTDGLTAIDKAWTRADTARVNIERLT